MSYSFYPSRTILDLQKELNGYKETINRLENNTHSAFQITRGAVLGVSKDRSVYKVYMTRENVVIEDVPLFMDKAYYQIIGFPNIGDVVKVYHFNNFTTSFIITKVYIHNNDLVMQKGSSIAMGANVP